MLIPLSFFPARQNNHQQKWQFIYLHNGGIAKLPHQKNLQLFYLQPIEKQNVANGVLYGDGKKKLHFVDILMHSVLFLAQK